MRRLEKRVTQAKRKAELPHSGRSTTKASGRPQVTEIERHEATSRDQPAINVSAYETASVDNTAYKDRLHEAAPITMADWIAQVVEFEGPVHEDEVARRIVNSAGIKRLGRRIQAAFESGRSAAVRKKSVIKKGGFLWKPNMRQPILRSRSELPSASRKLEFIAPEEIEVAMVEVIKASYGIRKEDIPSEVCSLFGFQRVTEAMRSIVDKVSSKMLSEGSVVERGENFELPK